MLKKFEYRGTAPSAAEIYVNDMKLDGVTEVNFDHQIAMEVPEAIVHLAPFKANINQLADLHLAFDPQSAEDAIKVLALFVKLDDEYYNKARTALHEILCDLAEKEMDGQMCAYDRAGFIIERLLEDI